jgi:hypothetical protein
MKKCPYCGTQYSDVTLSFCLQDGTPLVMDAPAETPTAVLGETATRVRVPVAGPESAGWNESQVTRVAAPPPAQPKRSYTGVAVALTAVGMLVLFGIIGVAAIVFFRNSQQPVVSNLNNRTNTTISTYSTPYTIASPVRTPPPSPAMTPQTPPDRTPPPLLSSYPSTTRLKFSHGSYSTSFSGEVNPGDTRSLVLSCRSGQSLSASISSGASCVSIRGGGSSYRTTTSSGDNYITVANTCSSVAHFSISITII